MVLGAVGTVALASPASAHTPEISYDVKCGPTAGTAVVTWTVKNKFKLNADVTSVNRTIDGIAVDVTIPAREAVTGTETVTIAEKQEALSVGLEWTDGFSDTYTKPLELGDLTCVPQPVAKFVDNCDGTTVVTVTNPEDGEDGVKVSVNGSGEFVKRFVLGKGETSEPVTVPADNNDPVRVKFTGGDVIDKHTWERPEKCHTVDVKSTCDNLVITVTNDGLEAITATVKAGDEEKSEEIGPGETAEATIPGSEGLVATLTVVDGGKTFTQEVKYEKPSDCAPTLPVTGVNAGLLAGAALLLVSGGMALFVAARRRRIRFAA
jgi:hypothetical protein